MDLLYIIQKPCSMVKWFTKDPDIAGYAFCEGWSVKCKNKVCKVIK
jgi:hypothetical protein